MSWRALLFSSVFFAILSPPGRAEDKPLTIGEDSKRACRERADPSKKLDDYVLCLSHEYNAAQELMSIAAAVPKEVIYLCNSQAIANGDTFSRSWMGILECINRRLASLPESELPTGSATLYSGGVPHRYWTAQQCQQNRAEGQVCVLH